MIMKFIKTYKLFESTELNQRELHRKTVEDMLDMIDDIGLELNDMGLIVSNGGPLLTITIWKSVGRGYIPFKLNETIIHVINRLYDYLSDFDFLEFESIVLTDKTGKTIKIKDINSLEELDKEFILIIIEFPENFKSRCRWTETD